MAAKAKEPRRRGRWRRRLLLLAVAMVVPLLLAEGSLAALSLYPPQPRNYPNELADRAHPTFTADPQLGWRGKPGLDQIVHDEGGQVRYCTDQQGLRTGPNQPASDDATRSLLLAGDSFLWGVGVAYEHTLASRLEAARPGLRVHNVAQPGFGMDQIVLSVEQALATGAPPSLVVVGIYPNDLSRSHTSYRHDLGFNKPAFALRGGKLEALTAEDRPSAIGRFFEDHSRLLGLWRRAQRNLGFKNRIGSWWSLNEALLERLRDATSKAGCPLLLVHIPFADWRPFASLRSWCLERSVPLVDPVAAWPKKPDNMNFPPAGHFTPTGHRLTAELVLEWIREQGPTELR